MIFRYKAINSTGQIIEGFHDGNSEEDVIAMLKDNDNTVILVERDVEAIELFPAKVKKKDLAVFCRQFYTMLDSGLGIVKCLDILGIQSENKTLRKTLIAVNENVQKGLVLSEAMKQHPNIFPTILVSMVAAGEVSGNLDTIMDRMATHFEKENKIEAKIKSAMVYPTILAIISVLVVIFMLIVVLPTFIGMFGGIDATLPKPTRILLSISNSMQSHWYLYGIGLVSMLGGIKLFVRSKLGRYIFDSIKLKLPIIKNSTAKIITSRFSRTLSTLMSAGIPLIQSMEVVSKVVDNVVVEESLMASIDSIRKGMPLSRAIKNIKIYPPMVEAMIKIGEESGSLDEILFKTADFYDQEVEEAVTRATSLLEPLMIVVMGLIIGFLVIAMYLPMFEIMSRV